MKQRKKQIRQLICIWLAAVTVLLTAAPALAAEGAPSPTVRIGYIDYDGFITQQADGTFSGYGVDFLNAVSGYTGWNYEYVYGTWSEQMQNLKDGSIDFVCHAQKTTQREQDYLFSQYSTGTESSVLYAAADDTRFYYDDFDALNGITIAFLDGSFQNDVFAAYAEKKGFSYHARYYETVADAFAALDSGSVDAVAMGSLSAKSGYKLLCRFGSDPFYLMSGTQNADLMNAANDALSEILGSDPYYFSDLYSSYYGAADAAQGLNLTREEADFIAQGQVFTVGCLPARTPFSTLDTKTGTMGGIVEDLLLKISQRTGLQFDIQPIDQLEKPIAALKAGKFDLVAGILLTNSFRSDSELWVSNSLLDTTMSVVMTKGSVYDPSESYTIVMPTAFQAMQEYISANYPNYTVICKDNQADCIEAVRSGEADVFLQNMYVINYLMQKPKYSDLEIMPTSFITEQDGIAALSNQNPLLISIVNKGIASLTSEDTNRAILSNTTAKPYVLTFGDVLYKYRVPFLLVGSLLLVCLALFLVLIVSRQRHLRTVRKKNTQLSEAVNQAERANIAKSQFLARMSHEIRTPMNAIVGITTIARVHKQDPEKVEQYLDKIDTSSRVLLNIINDVLDMSAIESDKLKIASSEFDMKQILSSLSAIYYAQCKDKGIQFSLAADITDEMLVGDGLRVNQILLNLISNAFKFTDVGGSIDVVVSQTQRQQDMVFLQFVVHDTGCGMNKEMLSRLFQPFEQETADTAQKHGGSGLGLSITKNLVDMMHGAIHVESEKGKGTTFTVELPFQAAGHRSEMDLSRLKDLRALIVDDDKSAREYTSIVLQRIGVTYDVAVSGENAIEMATEAYQQSSGYDICFVDWRMPGMNGITVTKKLRNLFDRDTLIIIVSAYDLSEVEDEAKQAGADLCVTKPLFQSTVFNVLMQLSGGKYTKQTADQTNFDFTGHKVLLAEDNELNSEIALELLALVHMDADHAKDGQEAVEKFNASAPGTYDAILMDIQMPKLDGYGATDQIRAGAHPEAATIPIFAMTANAFTEDVSTALSHGMNGHIAKPIDTTILYETLHKAIFSDHPQP